MARIVSFRRVPVRRSPPCAGGSGTAARPWPVQADSLLRPFARRRASTRRPPLEAMRARKPCSRFRARFLGWYVCFAIRPCSIPLRSAIPNWRASKHTKRLADASLTRSARGPVSLRRILPAPRRGRQTSSQPGLRIPIVWPERRLLHYRDPQGRMPFRRPPARPGGVRFRTPLSVAQAHWRLFIDGCEAGMARRPR